MKRVLCLLLAFLMLFSLAACAAGEPEEPMDPWLADLIARAEAGDIEAMKELGGYYAFPEEGREPDYEKGIGWYQKASDALDVEATDTLGWFYEMCIGVEQDKAKADELYYKSWQIQNGEYISPEELAAIPQEQDWDWDAIYWGRASEEEYAAFHEWLNYCSEQGDAECTNILGDMYRDGLGVELDLDKALAYYEKAAEMGSASALTNLGYMYRLGIGVEVDALRSAEYYERAIALGDAQAMADLGFMLFFGFYELNDSERGMELCRLSAEAGNPDGIHNYAFALEIHGRKYLKSDESKLALEYYLKSAELGDIDSWNDVGDLYASGDMGYPDYENAEKAYMKGVELGYAPSMFRMCEMYLYGKGRPEDRAMAREWLDKGLAVATLSEIGFQSILFFDTGSGEDSDDEFYYLCSSYIYEKFNLPYNLGLCYLWGLHVEKDLDKYVEYMALSCELGDPDAALNLGEAYEEGIVEYSSEKAAYWWLKAAELGNAEGMLKTAYYHYYGTAGDQSYEKAAYWYTQALEHGNQPEREEAAHYLESMRKAGFIPAEE